MSSRRAARHDRIATVALHLAFGLALLLPAMLTVGVIEAQADEAYVCEGGRVVTVRLGELDVLKRKDPCIAAYYGIALDAETIAAATDAGMPPLPGRKPATLVATAQAAEPIAAGREIVTSPRVERVVFRHAVPATAARVAPTTTAASVPVDFRRIPIINAAPGTDAIFYHTR